MAKKETEKKVKAASCSLEQLTGLGPQSLNLGDQLIGLAVPREFSTGSYGYGYTGPTTLKLPDGSYAVCQVSVNIVVKHSGKAKEAA